MPDCEGGNKHPIYVLDHNGRAVPSHDCTTWTERTDQRLAALEDAVNRMADKLTYLLLKLDDGGG
jgi:hypothetical protein